MSEAILGALIGLGGLLIGLLGSEYFRRKSRIEEYSREIFQKRPFLTRAHLCLFSSAQQRLLSLKTIS